MVLTDLFTAINKFLNQRDLLPELVVLGEIKKALVKPSLSSITIGVSVLLVTNEPAICGPKVHFI